MNQRGGVFTLTPNIANNGIAVERLDCVVVGAGVIGLAVARELALLGREVVVLEAEDRVGAHTSSRNSEVIHAGIYYPQHSLKAQLCVAGKHLLYRYCEARRVPFRRIGKMIVATRESEHAALRDYLHCARNNGVGNLHWLDAREAKAREPEVQCMAALWSPGTGIIDSHAYLQALQADIESANGTVVLRSRVESIDLCHSPGAITFEAGSGQAMRCNMMVNATGLWASELAARMHGLPDADLPQTYYSKGHYYSYSGQPPFSTLVYPVATAEGLGIHATCDLAGEVRFGPDNCWVDSVDYRFDTGGEEEFANAIRRYYPAVEAGRLQPAYTGIRPKVSGPGDAPGDFIMQGPSSHGIAGLVNLFGIESPGLTASLAIARRTADMLLGPDDT